MADTMRTLGKSADLLGDNTAGEISPQDLRDVVLQTIQPGHGEISLTSSSPTGLSDTTTWVQIAGVYALSSPAMNWEMLTLGQLRYTGPEDRVLHIAMSVSFTTVSNNQVIELGVGKDGTIITPSIVSRKTGTGADVGSTAVQAFTTISNGSYIAPMTRNTTSATNMTAAYVNLFVMDMAK